MRYFPEKHEPILNLAPYDHLVGNILFDPGDTASLFLRVAPIPFHLKGQTEKASIRRKLQALLNLLPEDVKLQVIYDRHCDIRGYLCNHALLLREARGKGHPLLPHIVGSRIGMYKDLASRERVFDEEIYVVVSRPYPQLRDFNREVLTREDSPEAAARRWEGVFRGIFEDLRRLENLLKEGLGQVTSVEVPSEQEIFRFLFRTMSLSSSYFRDGFFRYVPFSIRPLAEQASALLELIDKSSLDHLRFLYAHDASERLLRVVSLYELPPRTLMGRIAGVSSSLGFPVRVTLVLRPADRTSVMRQLKLRSSRVGSILRSSGLGGSSVEAEHEREQIVQLMENFLSGEQKPFEMELYCVFYGRSREELDRKEEEILRGFANMGGKGMRETYGALWAWASSLPANPRWANPYRSSGVSTVNAVDLAPLLGSFKPFSLPYRPPIQEEWAQEHPVQDLPRGRATMLLQSPTGCLIPFDPLDPRMSARNSLVVGATGSGKSFGVAQMILNCLVFHPKVVVVDQGVGAGGSFKKLCQVLGGSYFGFSPEERMSLNPFFKLTMADEPYFTSVLAAMTRDRVGDDVPQADRLIFSELFYRAMGVMGTEGREEIRRMQEEGLVEGLLKVERTVTLEDLVGVLLGEEMTCAPPGTTLATRKMELGHFLSRWTMGERGRWFASRGNDLNLDADVVVFDLKGFSSDQELQQVVFLVVARAIWRAIIQMAQMNRDTMVVFDEAWKFLSTPSAAAFMAELFRVVRKYRGAITSISQNIADFASNPIARDALLQNSQLIYIFKYPDLQGLRRVFDLGDHEVNLISGLGSIKGEYSEVFVRNVDLGHSFVARIKATPFEYWIATTDPSDMALYNEMLERLNGDVLKTLRVLARMYPRGNR